MMFLAALFPVAYYGFAPLGACPPRAASEKHTARCKYENYEPNIVTEG